MPEVHLVDQKTNTRVITFEVQFPKGSPNYEKFMSGLTRKVDFDRFYIEQDK